jgi:histidine triad (HIT) family protein
MSTSSCIFCRIVAGEAPGSKVYSDDRCVAFNDIYPVAPRHILLVPRQHVEALAGLTAEHEALLGHLLRAAPAVARAAGIAETGYRVSINQGKDAGQLVPHLHLHIIGGKALGKMA